MQRMKGVFTKSSVKLMEYCCFCYYKKWVNLLCLLLIVFLQVKGSGCCSEAQRLNLLELKSFLSSEGYDADYLLPSWTTDHSTNCCDWGRVTCNHTTGHVIELSLDDIRQTYSPDDYLAKPWFLNLSLFQPFDELILLNLSFNGLAGWLQGDDPGGSESLLLGLGKLEILDLSYNKFNESIMLSLKRITSLEDLILAHNSFESFPDLSSFEKLEMLDLSYNQLYMLSLEEEELKGLSSMQILDLKGNAFRSIPPSVGAISSLRALSMRYNKLDDSSSFEGIFPFCLHNLTALNLLDLSWNEFTGEIPSQWIAGQTSLRYIDLAENYFGGLFSLKAIFANHSKLEMLALGSYYNNYARRYYSNLVIQNDEDDSGWVAQFQLKSLVLSNCNLNTLPSFLLHQKELRVLDLSHNKLKGRFPGWLLANNSGLKIISLRNNSFTGDFYVPVVPMTNAKWFDVSYNQMEGNLPQSLGKLFPHLEGLLLSKNSFDGQIPPSIGDNKNIKTLDLSNNKFVGQVPSTLDCSNLEYLILSNNNLDGDFFSTHNNFTALSTLLLNNNRFTGTLSNAKFWEVYFHVFDVSNNLFSGQISSWIGNSKTILWETLAMRNNSFQGNVPCQIFSASYLDLSYNLLSGPVPYCSNIHSGIYQIHLQANNLTGSLPEALFSKSSLFVLNMRDNKLTGSIPNVIGAINLRVLLLGGNQLAGSIPGHLCWLKQISLLDLSNNFFSGHLPQCFSNISFGEPGNYPEIGHAVVSPAGDLIPESVLEVQTLLKKDALDDNIRMTLVWTAAIDFVTKNRKNFYQGDILNYMSGLDLSCNQLAGEIPPELGNFFQIHALNLSHNRLTGSIPRTFSNLNQIESLDLSHNSLSGEIPSELVGLTFLAVFSVAYNNLTGKIPDRKAQFGTFDNSSYEGN